MARRSFSAFRIPELPVSSNNPPFEFESDINSMRIINLKNIKNQRTQQIIHTLKTSVDKVEIIFLVNKGGVITGLDVRSGPKIARIKLPLE